MPLFLLQKLAQHLTLEIKLISRVKSLTSNVKRLIYTIEMRAVYHINKVLYQQ